MLPLSITSVTTPLSVTSLSIFFLPFIICRSGMLLFFRLNSHVSNSKFSFQLIPLRCSESPAISGNPKWLRERKELFRFHPYSTHEDHAQTSRQVPLPALFRLPRKKCPPGHRQARVGETFDDGV